ncbi:MAG: NACHT domain-containing protein, partial [Microcystaceae cyanobacterium]
GTGKTLFLQYLAKVLLADPQAPTVLWLSPFQLKNISLRDYLFGSWLTALAEFTEWPLADTKAFLEEEIRAGRVWILADGMDYLYSDLEAEKVSGPLSLLGRSLQPWGNNLHLVLVCRPET